VSCSDIINSDNNVVIIPKGEQPGLSKWLEYRFTNDVLSFRNNDTTVLWQALLNDNWSKPFYIVNVSQDSIYEITSLSLADGRHFSLSPASSIPIKLQPNQANTKNLIFITMNTKDLIKGIYTDKIIINNNPQIGLFIRLSVN
jgi:hypothetical protein